MMRISQHVVKIKVKINLYVENKNENFEVLTAQNRIPVVLENLISQTEVSLGRILIFI